MASAGTGPRGRGPSCQQPQQEQHHRRHRNRSGPSGRHNQHFESILNLAAPHRDLGQAVEAQEQASEVVTQNCARLPKLCLPPLQVRPAEDGQRLPSDSFRRPDENGDDDDQEGQQGVQEVRLLAVAIQLQAKVLRLGTHTQDRERARQKPQQLQQPQQHQQQRGRGSSENREIFGAGLAFGHSRRFDAGQVFVLTEQSPKESHH